jgi:Secretion system C-terminal sorting domain
MKRLIPICIAIIFVPWLISGQITLLLDPPTFTMTGVNTQTDISYHVKVINSSNQTASLLWSRRVSDGPAEWLTWVCDANLCYTPEVGSIVTAGDTVEFQMHLNPRLVNGTADYNVTITDLEGNPLAVIDGEVCIPTCTTGTKESSDVKLSVFPNPTTDYFQISDLAGLRYIELFNIVGNKIRSFDAAPARQYYVGDLSEGMYLVRLMDSTKKILKTVRLSIR